LSYKEEEETHTHTHTYIYIYIYREREREREQKTIVLEEEYQTTVHFTPPFLDTGSTLFHSKNIKSIN
jgi:hypothetical protein